LGVGEILILILYLSFLHFHGSRFKLSLETHMAKAREAGATEDEIKHALLLIMQTTGFPMFMESYAVFKSTK
jgi:alkylhydroperoxidase/carboxymuconolactone decarboxylase family protein YurZ